jgi:hypothetical protein
VRNQEIAFQQIGLMGHIEEFCDRHVLTPPVKVNIIDANRHHYDLQFIPGHPVELPIMPVALPLQVELFDAIGEQVNWSLSNLRCLPEWTSQSRQMPGHNYLRRNVI